MSDAMRVAVAIPAYDAAARAGADLVLGTRRHLFGAMSRVRRMSNSMSSWAISKVARADVGDTQTGFRLYARRLIEATGFPEPRFETLPRKVADVLR